MPNYPRIQRLIALCELLEKEEYHVMAAVAVGRRGEQSQLPADLAEREFLSPRKPLAEGSGLCMVFPGQMSYGSYLSAANE